MFHEGDYVMYSGMGLCTVEKIGTPDFQPKGSQYYFLRQADDRSRIYVPVDTRLPMRKPITGPEAERFLEALSAEVINVPKSYNHKTMLPMIKEMVRPQTAEAMGRTIKTIRALHPDGKYPGEEKAILDKTVRKLNCELAYAMHISETEADSKLRKATASMKTPE